MAHLSLILLGGFQARLPSGGMLTLPKKKAQALLAYLALRPGQAHPRDKLATLLWGDTGEEQARHSLRQTLFALRQALPMTTPPCLLVTDETIALNPASVDVDVATFTRLVAEGTPRALEQAVALYQGDLLEGLGVKEEAFEEWLMTERERLRELALEALAKLLAHQTKAESAEAAIQTAVQLLALDPLQEAAHRALMRLYIRQRRRGAALRQYQVCVRVLQRELGVEPEEETKQLYQEILQQGPSRPLATEVASVGQVSRPRRRHIRSRLDAVTPETPLVGRKLEIDQLRRALDEAWRGRGQIVAILGEAGIGKSRMTEEIAAEGLQRGGRVLIGRSYETEQILPFGPWVDALRTGEVISEIEGPKGLPSVWQAELARLFPELGEPGLLLPAAPEDYLRLFEAMAQLVELLASRQPLLMILDDLHWADEMSVRLLSFLGRRVQGWPVLVAGTAREEELAGVPMLRQLLQELHREPRFVAVALSPLSHSETLALVQTLARAGSEESQVAFLGEQVWAVSEGNPFMVVETMRALQEGTTPEGASRLPLPERVREVIAGRLERLSERSQHLVAVAAVVGREFDFALLERAAGLGEREAAEGVEELVRRRVLTGVGERFDFTHDRIREVAYGQLLLPRRKLLHGLVAKAMEELYAENLEPHYLALGVHYREGEAWGKALAYFRQAGVKAVTRSAYREAVACFEEALAALKPLPETRDTIEQAIDLRFDLRNSLIPLGEHERILARLREAETLAVALDDHHRLGWVFAYMTEYFWLVGNHDRAIECGQRALAIAEARDFAPQIVANFYLGVVYHVLGDHRRAIDFLGRNMAVLEGGLIRERFGMHGIPSVLSQSWLVMCLAELGEFAEGIARGEEAVRIAEVVDHPFSLVVTLEGVGFLHLRKGDLHEAIPGLERGLETCQTWHIPLLSPLLAAELGYAYALSGRLAEALPPLEQAVEQAASIRMIARHSLFVTWLSEAYLLAGRIDQATEFARRALGLSRDRKQRGYQAWTLRLLGEITSHQDPPDVEKAEEHYREALALAEELGMRPLLAHCHLGLGRLYGRAGDRAKAREHLSATVTMLREMDMRLWLEQAEAEVSQLR